MTKEKQTNSRVIVVDASNTIIGRLASFIAKQALLGKEVKVVNCEKAVVSGKKSMVIYEYYKARVRGGTSLQGPHFPKSPDRIVKRTVRGMLSFPKGRGVAALKRVICYNDVPKEFESSEKINVSEVKSVKTITLKELSERI